VVITAVALLDSRSSARQQVQCTGLQVARQQPDDAQQQVHQLRLPCAGQGLYAAVHLPRARHGVAYAQRQRQVDQAEVVSRLRRRTPHRTQR